MPDVLFAVAEPNRRRLLQMLAAGPSTVNALAANFPVTRSAISQHLRVLADAGLVTQEKVGRQRFYSLVPAGMAALRDELNQFWTDELDLLVSDAAAENASHTSTSTDSPANSKDTHARRKVSSSPH